MKSFVFCLFCIFCSTVLYAQKSKENILKAYRTEGAVYFDSLAKSKNSSESSIQAERTYNEARLEQLMKKVSDSLSTNNSKNESLIQNLDKAIKREFNPPASYFQRIRKRLKA